MAEGGEPAPKKEETKPVHPKFYWNRCSLEYVFASDFIHFVIEHEDKHWRSHDLISHRCPVTPFNTRVQYAVENMLRRDSVYSTVAFGQIVEKIKTMDQPRFNVCAVYLKIVYFGKLDSVASLLKYFTMLCYFGTWGLKRGLADAPFFCVDIMLGYLKEFITRKKHDSMDDFWFYMEREAINALNMKAVEILKDEDLAWLPKFVKLTEKMYTGKSVAKESSPETPTAEKAEMQGPAEDSGEKSSTEKRGASDSQLESSPEKGADFVATHCSEDAESSKLESQMEKVESDLKPSCELKSSPEKDTDTKVETSSEVESSPEKVADTEVKSSPEKVADTEVKSSPEKVADTDVKSSPEKVADTDVKSSPEKVADTEVKSSPEKVADTDVKSSPEKVADTDVKSSPEKVADTDVKSSDTDPKLSPEIAVKLPTELGSSPEKAADIEVKASSEDAISSKSESSIEKGLSIDSKLLTEAGDLPPEKDSDIDPEVTLKGSSPTKKVSRRSTGPTKKYTIPGTSQATKAPTRGGYGQATKAPTRGGYTPATKAISRGGSVAASKAASALPQQASKGTADASLEKASSGDAKGSKETSVKQTTPSGSSRFPAKTEPQKPSKESTATKDEPKQKSPRKSFTPKDPRKPFKR